MNRCTASILMIALVAASGASRGAEGGGFELETRVYVYKNSDFQTIAVPGRAAGEAPRGVVFRAPATARFDQETLSLDGSSFTWSGGRNPPARFSLIATPTVPLVAGTPVTLSSSEPVQYLEQLPNGTYKICEIPRDSPEAPHCRLTFSVEPAAGAGGDPALSCQLDIATVTSREAVAGLALEVGKPVLARFRETLHSAVRTGVWSALICQAPNGSDYSMLVLLRLAPGRAPAGAAATVVRPMTAAELAVFVTHYYLHPRPDLIPAAIAGFGPSGFAKDREVFFGGFLSTVLAANPERIPEWSALLERQDNSELFRRALALDRPKPGVPVEAPSAPGPGGSVASAVPKPQVGPPPPDAVRPAFCWTSDREWGAFFASGSPEHLQRIVEQLGKIDERRSPRIFWEGAAALWSLARNALEHPVVRTTLEALRTEVDPRTRELIDELLTKDPEAIRRMIAGSERDLESPSPEWMKQVLQLRSRSQEWGSYGITGEREHASAETSMSPRKP